MRLVANRLNCFSPPVMITTMVIETTLAAYSVWRYKMNRLLQLSVAMLLGLATFQLAEFFVCTGSAGHSVAWSRLGFVAITTLPPLGLHILHVLAGKPARKLMAAAYASMLAFVVFFLAYPSAFANETCNGNYVIFHLTANAGGLYYFYYYGWLALGIAYGIALAKRLIARGGAAQKTSEAVQGMLAGYLVFLVPTTVVNTLKPSTINGLPSVMCGFAVLFALILALYVLPRAGTPKLDKNR